MHPDARIGAAIAAAWIAPLLLAVMVHRYLRRATPVPMPRLRAVVLGMFVLGGLSLIVSQLFQRVLMAPWQSPLGEAARLVVEASFGAGLPEEAAKVPLILVLVQLSGARTPAATVLCGLAVGLGFAAYENTLTAVYGVPLTVFTNRVTSTMSHGFWGILAGSYIGMAYRTPVFVTRMLLLALLVPALLHSIEDFLIGMSIPGSLVEAGLPAQPPDAEPTIKEIAAALGATAVWLAQLVWCWRTVRSCRPTCAASSAPAPA